MEREGSVALLKETVHQRSVAGVGVGPKPEMFPLDRTTLFICWLGVFILGPAAVWAVFVISEYLRRRRQRKGTKRHIRSLRLLVHRRRGAPDAARQPGRGEVIASEPVATVTESDVSLSR